MNDIMERVCVGRARVIPSDAENEPDTLRVVIAHTNRVDRLRTSFGRFSFGKRTPMAGYDHTGEPMWVGALSMQRNEQNPKQRDLIWEGPLDGLDDAKRRRTADAIKAMGDEQEFSYRFRVLEAPRITKDDVLHFPHVRVFESAPVYQAGTDDTGAKFARALTEIRSELAESDALEDTPPAPKAERSGAACKHCGGSGLAAQRSAATADADADADTADAADEQRGAEAEQAAERERRRIWNIIHLSELED